MWRPAWVVALLLLAGGARAGELGGRYSSLIVGLDSSDPRSYCAARAGLREWLPQAGEADAAAMFRAYRAFYRDGVGATYRRFQAAAEPFARDVLRWAVASGPAGAEEYLDRNPAVRQALGAWIECGFRITEQEGELYPAGDAAVFMEFARFLPRDLAAYVAFRNREDAQEWLGDAHIRIPWGDLLRRLSRWESFARRFPALEETANEVEPEIARLGGFFFFGVSNSPVYDRPARRIRREVTESWRALAEHGSPSRYRELAAALVNRLPAADGRITAAERPLFVKAGLGRAFDDWWRRYAPRTANGAGKK